MFSSFGFPFANFFQPGIYWPELAAYRPMQIIAVLALLTSLTARPVFDRSLVFRHPAVKYLLAFVLVQSISVYRSGVGEILSEFSHWSTYALFVLVSLWVITDARALKRYVWGMICGSMWIVAWGIWAVHAGIETENGGRAGAYGMYENHNDYSFIIVQILPFIYVLWKCGKGLVRWLLLASLLACLAGIALSLSRGGMIALVLEVALIVLLTMTPRARWVMLPLVAVLGAGAISYQYMKRAQNQGDSYTAEDAETSRQELWRAGFTMIKTHPILGIGSRTFGDQSRDYGEISHDNVGKNSHNTYIEVAATSGIIGFFCFMRMIWCAIRELRGPPPGPGEEWEILVRKAALIALLTICFRALFDAKPWDWSFYVLIVIITANGVLLRSRAAAIGLGESAAAGSSGTRSPADRPVDVQGRPPVAANPLPATNHVQPGSPIGAGASLLPAAGGEAGPPRTNHLPARQ